MYRHLLVPIDGTELSAEVVSRSVEFAHANGSRITFFYAKPDYAIDRDGALKYSIAPEMFMRISMGEVRGFLAKAEAAARVAGVPSDAVAQVSDRPYQAILDIAEERKCDLIFMAPHGAPGSQTLKVVAGAKIPVLVSVAETNTPTPMLNKAIAAIRDEHRSIASVLHGLKFLLDEFRDHGVAVDFELMKAMVSYLSAFSEKLHHPKEDTYLFPKVQEYTHELDGPISMLAIQHDQDKRLLRKLEQSLSDFEAGAAGGFSSFAELADQYAEFTWKHMAAEERLILPTARKYLTENDWEKIVEAFGENGDPRFGEEIHLEFRAKFTDITNRSLFPIGV